MRGQYLTYLALRDVAFAISARNWLIRIVPASGRGPIIAQTWDQATLFRSIAFLRHKNAQDHHIYGRPDSTRHVLVDDVDADALDAMKADGLTPSLIIETSKANYQAWVTLARGPVPQAHAAAAARVLARRYGGDPGAASAVQCGRLPGFRNRKPIYESNGRYPLVIVRRAVPMIAPNAPQLLADAAAALHCPSPSSTRGACAPPVCKRTASTMTPDEGKAIYDDALAAVAARFDWRLPVTDRSAADFHVARHLRLHGFSDADTCAALTYGSAKAAERGDGYVSNTVKAAAR